ncbi:MAG: class I SAM-dependent methyltransferase [Bacteroidota bacterium]
MNKIGKAIKALWWIARKPVLLNRVLTDEDTWQEHVGRRYGLPDGLPVIGMDQLVPGGPVSLGPMTFLDGGSLPTDMMLLATLAECIDNCHYFEIGTWRGESVATISSRAKSCSTLSLTDEEMRQMGMKESTIASHRLFSEDLSNVTHLRGDSREFDFAAMDRKFDLVFIDGDHHYETVASDTRNVFRHLVCENSIVVWHDYGFHPDKVRFEVMAAILDGAGSERMGQIYHVAHTKCAIYTGKRYSSRPASFPVLPEEYYTFELIRNKMKSSRGSGQKL